MARCTPVNTTVTLKQDADANNPFIIYFPSCTRVQRCGGCCNSDLLSCQPTEIRLRGFQVYFNILHVKIPNLKKFYTLKIINRRLAGYDNRVQKWQIYDGPQKQKRLHRGAHELRLRLQNQTRGES